MITETGALSKHPNGKPPKQDDKPPVCFDNHGALKLKQSKISILEVPNMNERSINQLAEETLAELERRHYAKISIVHFRQAFERIVKYALDAGEASLSERVARQYLLNRYGWDIDSGTIPTAHITCQLRAIRVLMCFNESGRIPGRTSKEKEPPDCFCNHYNYFITDCVDRGLSHRTIATRSNDICEFFLYVVNEGFSSIADVEIGLVDRYLLTCNARAPGAMRRVLSNLRCLFRSMFVGGFMENDLFHFIPPGSRYPTKPVQKLWTGEEAKLLLGSINRTDSIGKRDYALMLLILRYGMRTGDILNLKLTDIDWGNMHIRFRQMKTSVPNALPILDDVGWALADWITNARPKQASTDHVFIRLTAPYCGMRSLCEVLKRRMVAAGIPRSNHGKSGPHSLRHALASNMLASHVPLPVITAVLGHSSPESTRVYLHSDIEGLRQCALEVEGVGRE